MLGYIALGVHLAAALVCAANPSGGNGYYHGGSGHPIGGAGYSNGGSGHSNGGSGYPGGGSGYPGGGSGYPGGGSGYPNGGNGGYGGGYFPSFGVYYPVPNTQDKKLTAVDKLFAQLADLDAELHIFKEQLQNIQEQAARDFEEFLHLAIAIEQLQEIEEAQDDEIDKFEDVLDDNTEEDLQEARDDLDNNIRPTIDGNTNNLMAEATRLVMEFTNNTAQQAQLDGLAARLSVLKKRLNIYADTSFKQICANLEVEQQKNRGLKKLITSRKCVTGTVNIHRDDRRATALFQIDFGYYVPQIIYGISGYQFDLRARGIKKSPAAPGGFGGYGGFGSYGGFGGYGGGHHGGGSYGTSYEPNALGVFVDAFVSTGGITFQMTNLGFGDSDLISVKVNYQACSIGPVINML